MAPKLDHELDPKAFLFGPQSLLFGIDSFNNLRDALQDSPDNSWVKDTLLELPNLWRILRTALPKLQYCDGEQLLQGISRGLETGKISPSLFPLPNILLSPLTVVAQLTQYTKFMGALSTLDPDDDSWQLISNGTKTIGLCTGVLSAFAVGCSSSLKSLQYHGTVAVKLAMCIGALADAEEASPESWGPSISFSMSWNRTQDLTRANQILKNFPEAYISISVDEKRSTVTASKRTSGALIEQLKLSGIHVTELALSGRFHWTGHEEDVQNLIHFCDQVPEVQFVDVPENVLPTQSEAMGGYASNRSGHEIALREILLQATEWYRTTSLLYSSLMETSDAAVICFGSGHYMSPSIARKLGSRLLYVSDIEPAKSPSSCSPKGNNATSDLPLNDRSDDSIAVIGMSCHVPGAEDLNEFWELLVDGESQHIEVPTERFGMRTAWRDIGETQRWYGNFIKNFDTFDHKFFKKTPIEMRSTDPQHRIILKLAYHAVEQSGYFQYRHLDRHIGCYVGAGNVDYDRNIGCHAANAYSATGNLRSFTAGKISHYFGWTGPSITIDTACSSSSVAIHNACRAIINGECSTALAGGVNTFSSPEWFHNLAGASFLSQTGQCKPFDTRADGYCRGEGAGLVFLKKLSSALTDGDQIFGVLASTRVYQNQNCTAITVPNAVSLSGIFEDVVHQARLRPEDISVVEAHGTGTQVGDRAEYDSIRKVFGGSIRSRSQMLYLSSVKGQIGHTEFASGVISLLKTLLMIKEAYITPQVSFTSINPLLGVTPGDHVEIPVHLKPWKSPFRAALVNNYGASGSNASMVVTQAPKVCSQHILRVGTASFPFWFCGFDVRGLCAYIAKFRNFLRHISGQSNRLNDFSVSNLSFQVSRQSNRSLPYALLLTASSLNNLDQKLSAFEKGDKDLVAVSIPSKSTRPVILCFGGQISTYVGLDRKVHDDIAILRHHLDQCNTTCISLKLGSIYPEIFQKSTIQDIVKLQILLFVTQYSSAKTWIDCNIKVAAVVGHSFGELVALCIAEVYTLRDALVLVSQRARLVRDEWGSDAGSMLAVEADLTGLNTLIQRGNQLSGGNADVAIACYNGPRSFTIAGPTQAIQVVEDLAKNNSMFASMRLKRIRVTNAFHSALVNPLLVHLKAIGREITFKKPIYRIEHAIEHSTDSVLDVNFVANHMRNPVFFTHAVRRIAQDFPSAIWLEAGSNSTVTSMACHALGNPVSAYFQPMNITSDESFSFLAQATTKLWDQGLNICFWGHHKLQVSDYTPEIIPPYQFEPIRHWMELTVPNKVENPDAGFAQSFKIPDCLTTFVGYQDKTNRSALFRVNTGTDRFRQLTSANNVTRKTPATPGMLQVEIALDALTRLRPELKQRNFTPELQGIRYHNLFAIDICANVYLDVKSSDDQSLVWEWRLYTADPTGVATDFASATIVLLPTSDSKFKDNYETLARLSGRKRCVKLLDMNNADDVLQGRNLYRAYEHVIDYKEPLRHVTKIVGKGDQSAGRVTKHYLGDAWIDSSLSECFCQIAGMFINLMTSISGVPEDEIFLYDKISRWIRAPRDTSTMTSGTWDVLAVHHHGSNTDYISDVFAFNARDGSLVEAILGIYYRKVPVSSIGKPALQIKPQESQSLDTTITPATTSNFLHSTNTSSVTSSSGIEFISNEKEPQDGAENIARNLRGKALEIVSNLSGLDVEDIKDNSDLIELGIDSLMAMELAREVDTAFSCTLKLEQLMGLSDFQSLIYCIQCSLGLDEQDRRMKSQEASPTETKVAISHVGSARRSHGTEIAKEAVVLDVLAIRDIFYDIAGTTDDAIREGYLENYSKDVIPRSTELCIVYIVDALEELGCPIRSATKGQRLDRVQCLSKHERFMCLIYRLLESDARLIDIVDSELIRTAVPAPTISAETVLASLLHNEPFHAAEHKLLALVGSRFANLITGKEDGLQVMFGTPESREMAADLYANSPINTVWINQLRDFLCQVIEKLPRERQPLCILEVGAGTGGTTSRIVPLLAKLEVPVRYIMTDISNSLIASARKKYKKYPFVEFKTLDIERKPDAILLQSQHIILATNCCHATRNLSVSLQNLHSMLRSDGFLIMLEMTEQVPWVDFIFGLLEGWWLFEDDRQYVLQPATYWENVLHSVGFGHVNWTVGDLPESSIQRLIISHATGPRYGHRPRLPLLVDEAVPDSPDERWTAIDTYICKYTEGFVGPLPLVDISTSSGQGILVTGSTGSLGAHIVAELAQHDDIHKIICLNRPSTEEPRVRQLKSFEMRGISLGSASLSKLEVIETDTSKPMLGLSSEAYQSLVQSITHIVHSAWPISLTRPLRIYEPQFRIARNLIDLANEITHHRPLSFKLHFQFISSLAVVASYPSCTGKVNVPETLGTIDYVPKTGYAEAKFVVEHMLARTLHRYPSHFHTTVVRIAQIAGSTSNGYWNPTEYIPFLIKSSQVLGALPDLDGTLSWYPVNDVVIVLGHLLTAEGATNLIYHIDNPSRQMWRDMITTLAFELALNPQDIVPYTQWVERVRRFQGSTTDNPALQLITFFDKYFLSISCGGLILDTSKADRYSWVLREQNKISNEVIAKYITKWKQSGFL